MNRISGNKRQATGRSEAGLSSRAGWPGLAAAAVLAVFLAFAPRALAQQVPQSDGRPASDEPSAASVSPETGTTGQKQGEDADSSDNGKFKLSLGLGEEYTSNVNDSSNAKSDLASIADAKVAFDFKRNRLSVRAVYSGEGRVYALGNRTDEIKNALNATAKLETVKGLLFLEASDQNQLVYKNTALGTPQSADSTRSQTNQNTASASIYLTPHFSDRLTFKFGYKATAVLYAEGGQNNLQNQLFLNTLYQLTPALEVGFNATAQRQFATDGNLDRYETTGVARYTYAEKCYLYANAGAIFSTLRSGESKTDLSLNAGLHHTFGKSFFDTTLQQGYVDSPESSNGILKLDYKASVGREFSRGQVQVGGGYSKYSGSDTQTSEQVSLFAKGTCDLTSKLKSSVQVTREFNTSSTDNRTRWYVTGQLDYAMPRDISLTGYYKFKLSNSDNNGQNDYQSNIVGIKLTKTF